MHKLLSVDVSLPVIGQTLSLLVPRNIMGSALLETVEDLVAETFYLKGTGNLYYADKGAVLDYDSTLENLLFQHNLKLILM